MSDHSTTLTRGKGPYAVACQGYVRRFKSREAAVGFIEEMERRGSCPYAHQIVEEPSGV